MCTKNSTNILISTFSSDMKIFKIKLKIFPYFDDAAYHIQM